ncbi:MAG: chemotaxis protein CheB [Desulfohalobiaceae bacterium]
MHKDDTIGQEQGPRKAFDPAAGAAREDKAVLPVVGLGASAGGLEALKTFFSSVPRDSGLAYIVLVHLSPKQPSMMPQLLQKVTQLEVLAAEDGAVLQPDQVYVVPPHKEVCLYEGRIQLLDPVDQHSSLLIDFFFRALALDRGSQAAAVILSGTGSDGTVGLKEIKSAEGLVLAQSEESAKYPGMPRSAIDTGQVDAVLPPEEMPENLLRYFSLSPALAQKPPEPRDEQDWLPKIFALLRLQLGHDFSAYKQSTILRRIQRRMVLNQISSHLQYVRFLRESQAEVQALFRDLLIGVTNFFRDPKSFEVLKAKFLPQLIQDLEDSGSLRVWVPGCSSGEEVYSLAMIILECLDDMNKRLNLQIFATDIDKEAIERARKAEYPASIRADVSQERLDRFFLQEGELYRVRKVVRDCVVFSTQDVLKDPPFSRLHLLCCRNLLIYLSSDAQKKLLPLFHYTLLPGGVLMLGSSETVGGFTNLFQCLDSAWKIYRRREIPKSMQQYIEFPTGIPAEAAAAENGQKTLQVSQVNLKRLTRRAILARFAPPAVLVDRKGTILHVEGKTGKFLEPPSGPPSQNILDMAREGLRIELSSALRRAVATTQEVVSRGVQVRINGYLQTINLYVRPLQRPKDLAGNLLVAFEEVLQQSGSETEETDTASCYVDSRISELEQELQNTKETLHTTIEELESSNEELKSTNEELQSSNEELQSTNEELESSKEELQSLNEELQTVNSELQSKVEDLTAVQDDINNLLSSTEIAIVFVDQNLRIKRFSREAAQVISLIDSDVGRPLEHQASKLNYGQMIQDLRQVLDTLVPLEREVQTIEGKWYMMRIMPYRTRQDRIQGAVLTFRDVDAQKKAQERLQELS